MKGPRENAGGIHDYPGSFARGSPRGLDNPIEERSEAAEDCVLGVLPLENVVSHLVNAQSPRFGIPRTYYMHHLGGLRNPQIRKRVTLDVLDGPTAKSLEYHCR